jgi:hypothetical protein
VVSPEGSKRRGSWPRTAIGKGLNGLPALNDVNAALLISELMLLSGFAHLKPANPAIAPHPPGPSHVSPRQETSVHRSLDEPDPAFGNMLLEQADGELAAAMQYSVQGLNCKDAARKDMLMDIGAPRN